MNFQREFPIYCVHKHLHKLHLKLIRLTFNSIETSVLHSTVWHIYSINYSSSAEMWNYFICHQNSCSKQTNKNPPLLFWPLNLTVEVLKHKSLCPVYERSAEVEKKREREMHDLTTNESCGFAWALF